MSFNFQFRVKVSFIPWPCFSVTFTRHVIMRKLELFDSIPALLMLTLIALCDSKAFMSMADILDEQRQQQLNLPLWRSVTGLVPSFSPFRSLPSSAIGAAADDESGEMPATVSVDNKQKRRLVVRVPFAQNPDNLHLSRIYKSLFDPSQQSRAKKYELEGYGLRRFVPFF